MKVSRNLLQKYIDLQHISDDEIAKRLTFSGIEVESFETFASGSGLIIAEVLSSVKIKESDHLSLCQVNLGTKGVRQIVCGAPNVKAGQKVIVAQVGAVLPELTIKHATIKGYESDGMICALSELGVKKEYLPADDHGIYVLREDTEVGREDVLAYLGLNDTIFDIRPFANRSDMYAVYNIVKELGALFGRPYTLPTYDYKRSFITNLSLKVETPLVRAFTLTEVQNVVVGPSPRWLCNELLKHGFRPINNIVDIGNYVMLLTGRPLHMYDLDRVKDETFIVTSDTKTKFIALDEAKYSLEEGDQVISDKSEVLCLGGIIGALNSSVTLKTKRIAIEVAHFDATQIRLSATRLNLPSEASSRFSKGVNANNTEEAINLALHLFKTLIPNAKFSNSVGVEKTQQTPLSVTFDGKYINNLLGTTFSDEQMKEALKSLGFKITKDELVPPSHRSDIQGSADVAEEVIRLLGFEHVESVLPNLETTIGEYDEHQKMRLDVRKLLRHQGLYETLNYTLTSQESVETFKYLNNGTPLSLAHPMTPLRSHLRLNLLPSILETLSYNVSRQATNVAMFEISNVASKEKSGEHLAFVFYGEEKVRGLLEKREYDFYDAKGLVNLILNYLNISASRTKLVPLSVANSDFHPAQSVELFVDNKLVGIFGKLHPTRQKAFGLKGATIVGELDFAALLLVKTSQTKVNPPSRFPFVSRDLSLIIDKDIAVETLISVVKKAGGRYVYDVEVFDVYQNLAHEPTKKSVALTLTLLDSEKTLVEAVINETMVKIISGVQAKLKAEVRA